MAKRGGFPGMGMPGNMNNLMKQAQKMQRQMEENQKALEEKEFTAAAGGGAVEVTVSGKREVTKVKLAEEVVDPDDIEMLEDLVVNETMKLVEDDASMNAIIAKVMELQNQESTDLPIYEKQLKETEVGITNMLNAIQMGILTSSTKERLEALEDQRKELQARIAEERLAKPKMKEEFVRFNRKGRFGILF